MIEKLLCKHKVSTAIMSEIDMLILAPNFGTLTSESIAHICSQITHTRTNSDVRNRPAPAAGDADVQPAVFVHKTSTRMS